MGCLLIDIPEAMKTLLIESFPDVNVDRLYTADIELYLEGKGDKILIIPTSVEQKHATRGLIESEVKIDVAFISKLADLKRDTIDNKVQSVEKLAELMMCAQFDSNDTTYRCTSVIRTAAYFQEFINEYQAFVSVLTPVFTVYKKCQSL